MARVNENWRSRAILFALIYVFFIRSLTTSLVSHSTCMHGKDSTTLVQRRYLGSERAKRAFLQHHLRTRMILSLAFKINMMNMSLSRERRPRRWWVFHMSLSVSCPFIWASLVVRIALIKIWVQTRMPNFKFSSLFKISRFSSLFSTVWTLSKT